MRETLEFRINEKLARRYLGPEVGTRLGDDLRKVVLPTHDKRIQEIAQLQREFRARGEFFFLYWHLQRSYTRQELGSAQLLDLVIRAHFEPPGAMCGTEYDEAAACKHCGAGARQASDLVLDTRRIPRGKDISQSIAGEVVVSRRVVEAFRAHGLRGADFRPVLHRGRRGPEPSEWSQLIVTSRPLELSTEVLAGNNPFDLDERDEYRCPQGHVVGLNQLSELFVQRAGYDGSDVCRTRQLFGVRRGELRPEPRLLVTQPVRKLLVDLKARGCAFEVASFV